METYDVIIIGAGAAGYSAGIYATRFGLKTLLIGKEPGGQTNEAYEIDNYPGFVSISGLELMTKFKEQAEFLGVEILAFGEVSDVERSGKTFRVKTADGKSYLSRSLIIATGSRKRKLGIPGEDKFRGKGVAYCATCDAAFYKGKTVAVVGGGNAAVKSALLLTEHAKKVYLVYRKEKKDMRAMPDSLGKAEKNRKIDMIFRAKPKEIRGSDKLEEVVFEQDGEDLRLETDGLFVEIGWIPETPLALKLGISLDRNGKIKVQNDMSTNVKGVFAAGDITSGSNNMEQIVTSCSEGAIAAESAYNHVKK
ncbi:MAG: FAD-dependent oxidoreductase [Candidatus Aenigmarchaeota archaeon]|nr:FAD-dependent oxidoreductase [Candidatus Aenigmarchaeota archaeon]NIP40558.1 FAD-dependent oxidoreductase [Candidatus Aenigmarchaeota archaeon]NIQ18403.1 FAD-dependent oxidoreductase [Candidatus Aenigmarchaeota archaeon]